jgi:hypothetical protein
MVGTKQIKCKVRTGSSQILVKQDGAKFLADYEAKMAKAREQLWEAKAEADRWEKAMRSIINL